MFYNYIEVDSTTSLNWKWWHSKLANLH